MNEAHTDRKGTAFLKAICVATLGVTVALGSGTAHSAPCDVAPTIGGGTLGVSPGPVGPPSSLGWDVGSGQCNGSFITSTASFAGLGIELGLRAEQRRIGQVADNGGGDYTVQTGFDTVAPPATNRAWWNFHLSTAYEGDIDTLDALTLTITPAPGAAQPATLLPIDLLGAVRSGIDARNNQPNATAGFSDLYQISQNPVFAWFGGNCTLDSDCSTGTCEGGMCIGEEGAWLFTLTATEGVDTTSVSMCIHTPNASCAAIPTLSEWGIVAMSALMLGAVLYLRRRRGLALAS